MFRGGNRKNYGVEDSGAPVTTFFVTNLPGGVSHSLWMAFQPHGKVKDSYVAKKRDARGNFFGFVRIEGVQNVNEMLKGMNTIKIYEAKLNVSVARYDKNHKRFEAQNNVEAQDQAAKNYAPPAKPPVQFQSRCVEKGMTFSSVLGGGTGQKEMTKKTIIVEGKLAMYPKHCLGRSVLIEVNDVKSASVLRSVMNVSGLAKLLICYVGGLKFLITFKEHGDALGFIERTIPDWGEMIVAAAIWDGHYVQMDRLVRLKVEGVPLHLRDDGFLDKIGAMFGRVVQKSSLSWSAQDVSYGCCYVLSDLGKHIDEEIEIVWKEDRFPACVYEDGDVWTPQFVSTLSSSPKCRPAGSVESVNGGDVEVEEGEISAEDGNRNDCDVSPEFNGVASPENEP
ncbi:putative RNA recognition motif domain, nucleotide-binding alpha-beta plait domain superfamily [Helianthus annuus]|uniref:RNA recognition motif domain, nucleotide-binding alpha-beta plait domain superfamily n=1 Tax=Helianthus annuus TaxID=4232 RepID=A0A9K3IDM8_HELAN|nr:putative RNA recognition motif domain, nucleotide-binding alpha-beta plait domain superfamily [Helianthus annuus]